MFGISLFFSFLLELAMQKMSSGSQHHGGGMKGYTAIVPFLRIAIMMNFSIALILSSQTKKIINVLKTLHTPRVIFLPVLVIFRFVPLFTRDIKQIHESIKIRIGSFNFFTMLLKPLLFIRLIMAPSVIRALRSADELAAAAELKGISDTKKITNSSPEFFKFRDAITLIAAGIVAYITLLLNIS
jgi:energy-coupling factor transport system permease protein